jgi:uncharacterized protein with PhoU and TrkA domain
MDDIDENEGEREEREERPLTVRELLTEMKDSSELMVDLAYASIIFDDDELAEEVRELEDKMDLMNYEIKKRAMLAARSEEDAEQLASILQVASGAEKISNSAGDMVSLLEAQGELRPFLPLLLQRSEEKIRRIREPNLAGKTVGEATEDTGLRVIAIRRGKRWITGPEDDVQLRKDDILLGIGAEESFEKMEERRESE